MNNPCQGDTLIIIDIQAEKKAEIIQCVQDTFEYMPGWVMGNAALNAMVIYPEARFFVFNLTVKTFDWWRTNDSFSETMDEDEVAIKDLADISYLLEFVYENTENLRDKEDLAKQFAAFFEKPSWNETPPKKKRKKEEPTFPKLKKLNLSKLEEKLKDFEYHPSKTMFNPMDFIKIQEMPHPKAKVFYKDLSEQVAKECPPPKPHGFEKEMAEILKSYAEHCEKEKAKKVSQGYDKGWKYTPNPQWEGIMIKSPPYPFPIKIHDTMDY